MRKGELQQVAAPQELYDHPVNLFVGGFIGSPAMNMLEATVNRRNGSYAFDLGGTQTLTLDAADLADRPALAAFDGRRVILGIRPEAIEEASIAGDDRPEHHLRGKVELREALGSELVVHFTLPEGRAAQTEETKELARESSVEGGLESEGALLVGRFGARAHVTEGEPVEVSVDTTTLHFFDPDTGLGIYEQADQKGATT
jgi:multiple sugar transport system ATP-binding protein